MSCFNDGCQNTESLKYCSGCHIVKYCSSVCQKKNWSEHKKLCNKLKADSQTRVSNIKRCNYSSCRQQITNIPKFKCSTCKIALYCSKDCKDKDYESHHPRECKEYSKHYNQVQETWIIEDPNMANCVIIRTKVVGKKEENIMQSIKETVNGERLFLYGSILHQTPFCYDESQLGKELQPVSTYIQPNIAVGSLSFRKQKAAEFLKLANNDVIVASRLLKEWLAILDLE